MLSSIVSAASLSFVTTVGGQERIATVETVLIQEVAYVPLRQLVDSFGGGYNILTTRMRVDFMGATAWVQTNDDRVDALTIFSLRHSILRDNGEIMIAEVDVRDFFRKSFRADVKPYTLAPAVTPGPATPSPTPRPAFGRPGTAGGTTVTGHAIRVIVIDAGHGGYETGMEGKSGLLEKDLTLSIALKIDSLLRQTLSQKIVLTRKTDIPLTLEERAKLATHGQGDLLITLHGGGSMSVNARGGVVLYATNAATAARASARAPINGLVPGASVLEEGVRSRRIAETIADWFAEETAARVRGVHAAPCRLLESVGMPGVLVEVGCMTNPAEEALLQSDDYQTKVARGIAKGVIAYLGDLASNRSARSPEGVAGTRTSYSDVARLEGRD